jgi:WD40 repeat protein/uncharacterized caspase-like protein
MKIKLFLISLACLLFMNNQAFSQEPVLVPQVGHIGVITTIAYSKDGRYIASASDDDNAVKIWDVHSQKLLGTFYPNYEAAKIKSASTGKRVKFRSEGKGLIKIRKYRILSVAFSNDGKYLASAGGGKTVHLWNIEKWKTEKIFEGHDKAINSLCFSLDDKYLLSVSDDKYLVVMNVEKGYIHRSIQAHKKKIEYVTFSQDGKYFATCGRDKLIKLWDIQTLEKVKTFKGHKGQVNCVDFNYNDQYLASCSNDKTIIIWDIANGSIKNKLIGHKGDVEVVCFNPLNNTLASGGADKNILIWEMDKQGPVKTLSNYDETKLQQVGDKFAINSLSYSPDGNFLASSGFGIDYLNLFGSSKKLKKYLYLWDYKNAEVVKALGGDAEEITEVCISPDETTLLSSGVSGNIYVWDIQKAELKNTVECMVVNKMEFSYDGKYVFCGGNKINAQVRNTSDYSLVQKFRPAPLFELSPNSYEVAFTKSLLDSVVRITTIDKRIAHMKLVTQFGEIITSIAFSQDGKYLAAVTEYGLYVWVRSSGGWAGFNKIKWGINLTPRAPSSGTQPPRNPTLIAFNSLNNNIIVYSESSGLREYEVSGRKPIHYAPAKRIKEMVVNSQGSYMAVTIEGNDRIVLLGLGNQLGDTLLKLEGHDYIINSLCGSRKDKYLASGSSDGTIKLWKSDQKKAQITLLHFDDHYIFINQDNYYKTTKKGVDLVAFRQKGNAYTFEQFDIKYNRPDIILSELDQANEKTIKMYKKAYEKRLRYMGFSEEMLSGEVHLPDITLKDKSQIPLATNDQSISLTLEARDEKYKLDRINIWINNVSVYGLKGLSLKENNSTSIVKEISINLASGKNKIQISCHNEKGMESLKETFFITREGEAPKPKLYIVSLGVSNYKDTKFNLTYAAKDALDIAQSFANNEEYEKVIVKTMTDSEVTKDKLQEIRAFLEQAGRDDVVMLFIAGHGVLDEELDYYYASHDMDFSNPKGRGIKYEEIEALLDGLRALKKIFFMDTCHSGEVDKEELELAEANNTQQQAGDITFRSVGVGVQQKEGMGLQKTSEMMKELFTDLRKGTGATVISSAGGGEYAMESEQWKNGLFTYCLLKGIQTQEADLNSDGEIMLSELQRYVQSQVLLLSRGMQKPTSRIENIEMDFKVW